MNTLALLVVVISYGVVSSGDADFRFAGFKSTNGRSKQLAMLNYKCTTIINQLWIGAINIDN